MQDNKSKPALIFVWEQFAPYHVDRIEAVAARYGDGYAVVGVEIAQRSRIYAWKPTIGGANFTRRVLFPDAVAENISRRAKLSRLLRVVREYRAAAVFLCDHDRIETLAALVFLRLRRIRVFLLLDAKFDDRPRRALIEALKQPVLRLFAGGIAGGTRHLAYCQFLGLPDHWVAPGYSALSVRRVREEAGVDLAPGGLPHAERDFVLVARFVAKKDVATAINAYALFRRAHPGTPRRLILCGSGGCEEELRAMACDGVVFTGFLDPSQVSKVLATALCLILPSLQEPWGLVVNEAIALNIPVLCSDNVGARDVLVRSGVNGYVFEPGNKEGLAHFMGLLSDSGELWTAMSLACSHFAPLADAPTFAAGVGHLVDAPA